MDPFKDRLAASAERADSWLCVGLDPDPAKYPDGMDADATMEFLTAVIDATKRVACAYKPNAAFFEALGPEGHSILADTIAAVPNEVPVILDGKRNDIGNTARKYAEAAFDEMGADALTVTPYLGRDTVDPFTAYEDRGVFLLARTSNPSAPEIQDLPLGPEGIPLWQAIATKALQEWNDHDNIGFVAGATYPHELSQIRALCGDGIPLLIPGVGAQGADPETTIGEGSDTTGRFALVNVGRAIMYAGEGADWKDRVQAAAETFADKLRTVD